MSVDNQGRPILYPGVQTAFAAAQLDLPPGYTRPPAGTIAIYDNSGGVVASNYPAFFAQHGWGLQYVVNPTTFTITPPVGTTLADGYGVFYSWQDIDNVNTFSYFDVREPIIPIPVLSAFGYLLNNVPQIQIDGH